MMNCLMVAVIEGFLVPWNSFSGNTRILCEI